MDLAITALQHGVNTASMTQRTAPMTATATATTTEKEKKMTNDFEAIAKELYEALMVMCQRRGIHYDDVDQVLEAREHYEQATDNG